MDFMLPKRESEEKYLLLPSVFGAIGLPRVFVEADLLSDGIIEVFIDFTLTDRAKEAFVGVVIALGTADRGRAFAEVACVLSRSASPSRETGLAEDVSS